MVVEYGLKRKLLILWLVLQFGVCTGSRRTTMQPLNLLERIHIPKRPQYNDSLVPEDTPDFRLEEDAWEVHKGDFYLEENRPYRMSPFYKQRIRWEYSQFPSTTSAEKLGCYCTTVFKRLTLLAGCAVITTRHLLTTATSTELVLKRYRTWQRMQDILGAWYDYDADVFNSSIYMTPARIHYHPNYLWPHQVNLTHPLPFSYDLAVWTATHKFFGAPPSTTKTVICARGGPHWFEYLPSTPRSGDLALIVGFQFVKAQRKIPAPWFRYVVQTRAHVVPCPKTEWHWYHCIHGPQWGRYGVESGAAWHRALEGRYWIFDGLIGMCAFSMKLRTTEITHYFTVLNTHSVLDFLYDAYMGKMRYRFLDNRFMDTEWGSPKPKHWVIRPKIYPYNQGISNPYSKYNNTTLPWY